MALVDQKQETKLSLFLGVSAMLDVVLTTLISALVEHASAKRKIALI